MVEQFTMKVGNKDMIVETGRLARQANGAVTVQYGGTMVLVTACMSAEPRESVNFLPLTVEYQEKTYAAGKIPGGFFRREGRPTEKETLTARLIDRPIRPLFPEGMANDIQVVAIVLSSDGEQNPDVLALVGASCALSMSNIPFDGPIGTVRVGKANGELIVNPTYQQVEEGDFELVVAGNRNGVVMVEGSAKVVPEEDILEAVNFGQKNLLGMLDFQKEISDKLGKEKAEVHLHTIDEELLRKVKELSKEKLKQIVGMPSTGEREEFVEVIIKELLERLAGEDGEYSEGDIRECVVKVEKEVVRGGIIERGIRVDGRDAETVRTLESEVSVLPRTHGSGLFTRGQTQSLSVVTLGIREDEQLIEALEGESFKSFMFHYNFPPFSVGEVRFMRGPGRREIGHGVLAERALKAVMPSKEDFPYTIRVVSEILESNGSSSMATVCAGALALMDAGVPVRSPVAGVAMGLIKEGGRAAILTDILGLEDHFGDMDFKLAGTREGVTALQLDLKTGGITGEILTEAVFQARKARHLILDNMEKEISAPRPSLSVYAPRIQIVRVKPEKIKDVIGPGGRTIKGIIAETGVSIDCQDDGTVTVASPDAEALEKAVNTVKSLTEDAEIGKVYKGKITRLMNFGAFCEILPGKEGLIHISELSDKYVDKVEDVVSVGTEFEVKVIEIDQQGRINLSRKEILTGEPSEPKKRRFDRGPGRDSRKGRG